VGSRKGSGADGVDYVVRHSGRLGPLMQEYYKSHKRYRRKFVRFEKLHAVNVGRKHNAWHLVLSMFVVE
jgi:hypothetical protein